MWIRWARITVFPAACAVRIYVMGGHNKGDQVGRDRRRAISVAELSPRSGLYLPREGKFWGYASKLTAV